MLVWSRQVYFGCYFWARLLLIINSKLSDKSSAYVRVRQYNLVKWCFETAAAHGTHMTSSAYILLVVVSFDAGDRLMNQQNVYPNLHIANKHNIHCKLVADGR